MTLTLQEAADQLGVHYMTVYRWVRTGRLPATKHGASWMVSPSDLAEVAHPTAKTADDAPPAGARTRRVDHVDRLHKRLIAGDEAGAMTVAEAALAGGMDPEALYLEVMAGAMARIGERWVDGEVSIAEEHQATAIMHRLLGRLSRNFTRRGRRRGTIVLGAASGDPHGLPTALIADPLRGRGFTVLDLGPDTPAEAFVHAATTAEGLIAVGITATTTQPATVGATISDLRHAGVTAPVLAGGVAIPDAETARRIGADRWAADGWAALDFFTAAARP